MSPFYSSILALVGASTAASLAVVRTPPPRVQAKAAEVKVVNVPTVVVSRLPTLSVMPAGTAFDRNFNVTIGEGDESGFGPAFTVPVGKRLILEHVSVHALTPLIQEIEEFDIVKQTASGDVVHDFLPATRRELLNGSPQQAAFEFSSPYFLTLEAGDTFNARAEREDDNGITHVTFTFHGQLIDVLQQ